MSENAGAQEEMAALHAVASRCNLSSLAAERRAPILLLTAENGDAVANGDFYTLVIINLKPEEILLK